MKNSKQGKSALNTEVLKANFKIFKAELRSNVPILQIKEFAQLQLKTKVYYLTQDPGSLRGKQVNMC